MTWNPEQYSLFSDHRLRPAIDLLSQVPSHAPSVIYDLGCGTGNVTALLSQHWNEAVVIGIDSSEDMLAKAKREHPSIEWKVGDIAEFSPTSKGNLIFSNAALHWLDDNINWYFDLLSPLADKINIWETTYFQVLKGRDAVLEWTRGTALRPFLAALDGNEIGAFESQYAERLMEAYPVRRDGSTLYPFSRLFIVVQLPED